MSCTKNKYFEHKMEKVNESPIINLLSEKLTVLHVHMLIMAMVKPML